MDTPFTFSAEGGTLRFAGPLETARIGPSWDKVLAAAVRAKGGRLVFALGEVTACDTGGATLLLEAERAQGSEAVLEGADERVAALLDRLRALPPPGRPPPPPGFNWRDALRGGLGLCTGGIAFVGEAVVALVRLPTRGYMLRPSDLLRVADQAGVRGIPLSLLLGVLIGLILSFQSLVPMRRFGADIYVSNLVAISLVRELGPLLAAVILAGRTGSAFAAEIGTMKVNEEIDALETMGLDPMTVLVLPRLIAAVLVMPALTIALELSGLLGMLLVMVGAGFPPVIIGNQVAYWVTPADFYGGLVKAAGFGAVVAAVGCRAGLSTGLGPRAVGLSTTRAVVGGIVGTILLDGLFAVLFYRLGL